MKIRVVSCVVAPDDYMVGHKEKPFQGYFTTELEICKLKKTVPQLLRYFTGAVTVQNRLLNTKHTKHTQKNTKKMADVSGDTMLAVTFSKWSGGPLIVLLSVPAKPALPGRTKGQSALLQRILKMCFVRFFVLIFVNFVFKKKGF